MSEVALGNQPVCTEVSVSASVGGKVQIVKFEYTADFHYSMSRKFSIPEGWKDKEIKSFQQDKTLALREELEHIAQAEMDELIKQRDEK